MENTIFVYDTDEITTELEEVWDHVTDPATEQCAAVSTERPSGTMPPPTIRYRDTISGTVLAFNDNEWSTGAPDKPHLRLEIDERCFAGDPDERRQRVRHAVGLATEIYRATDRRPAFVYGLASGMADVYADEDRYPVSVDDLDDPTLQCTTYMTIFTPPLVEEYGRERLRSAPAWHVEELDDGSIVVVAWDDPTTPRDDELFEYLGRPGDGRSEY